LSLPAATKHKADTPPAIAADPKNSCHCTPQIPHPKNTTMSKIHTTQEKPAYPKNLISSFYSKFITNSSIFISTESKMSEEK
jgi:hypothetical protein